jgi:BlaI family transcriptional regulator, penicillinase repressor
MTCVVITKTGVIIMPGIRLTKFEMQIMDAIWAREEASIREIQEAFPAKKRPGYTTIQKMVYRMEAKQVLRRVRKVGNFHVFAAMVTRESVERTLIDDLLAVFGGNSRPVIAHLIGAKKLTLEDVEFAEATLRQAKEGGKIR